MPSLASSSILRWNCGPVGYKDPAAARQTRLFSPSREDMERAGLHLTHLPSVGKGRLAPTVPYWSPDHPLVAMHTRQHQVREASVCLVPAIDRRKPLAGGLYGSPGMPNGAASGLSVAAASNWMCPLRNAICGD